MARESNITKEKVAAAVAELKGAGVSRPSAGLVREHLKKKFGPGEPVGAQNRIQHFLRELRQDAATSTQPLPAYQMPAALNAEIGRVIADVEMNVREELRATQELAVQELDEMSEEARQQAELIEELRADLACRTTERDSLTGEVAAMAKALDVCRAELSMQQATSADLNLALARAQVEVINAAAQMEAKTTEATRAGEALAKMRGDLDKDRELRLDAERRCAVAQVLIEAEMKARQLAEGQLAQLFAGLRDSEQIASRAAAAEAALMELRSHVMVLERLLERPHRRHGLTARNPVERQGERAARPPAGTP